MISWIDQLHLLISSMLGWFSVFVLVTLPFVLNNHSDYSFEKEVSHKLVGIRFPVVLHVVLKFMFGLVNSKL